MPRVPVLTSGRLLVDQGLMPKPAWDVGDDWAELRVVDVADHEASIAGAYWASGLASFLRTGDTGALAWFEGESVGGLPLLTDPDLLEDFDLEHGVVDFAEIYER
jgi:hypothetical protein